MTEKYVEDFESSTKCWIYDNVDGDVKTRDHCQITGKYRTSTNKYCNIHCMKSVQRRSFDVPYFPVFSPNTGKYGSEKTLYLDTFHSVINFKLIRKFPVLFHKLKNYDSYLIIQEVGRFN